MKKKVSYAIILSMMVGLLSGCSISGDYSKYGYEKFENTSGQNNNSNNNNYDDNNNYTDDGLVDDSDWDDGSYDGFYEDDDEFDYYPATVDIDKWSFANSGLDSKIGVNGYYMSYEDWIRLTKNLSAADYRSLYEKDSETGKITWYANVDNNQESCVEWAGSCYGMSVTAVLKNRGVYSAEELNASKSWLDLFKETTLSNAKVSKEDVSAINYFYMQQFLSVFQVDMKYFYNHTAADQVNFLKNCAKTQKPFMITFFWCDDVEKHKTTKQSERTCDHGHAVVGYGIEHGEWEFDGIEYDNKIVIYDCSYPKGDEDHDLYFNMDGTWTIPGYDAKSCSASISYDSENDNARLGMVSHDISHLNTVDFLTGEVSSGYKELNGNTVTSVQLGINDECTITSPKGTATIRGLEIVDSTYPASEIVSYCNLDGSTPSSTVTVLLPDFESYYTIKTKDKMDFNFRAGSSLLHVSSDSSGSAVIHDNYEVELNSDKEDAKTSIEIVTDADDDITGQDSILSLNQVGGSTVDIKPDTNGISIKADDAADITLGIENAGSQQNMSVNSTTNDFRITNNRDNIVVTEDSNKDGKYDTEIVDTPLEKNDSSIKISAKTSTYTGKNINVAKAKVTGDVDKVCYFYYKDKACTKEVSEHKNAGTYYVQAYGIINGKYVLKSNVVKLVINKAKGSAKLSKKSYSVKQSKKASSITLSCKADKTATFKKVSGNKSITVNSKGKITVKGGLKAGKYKIKVKVSSKNYKKAVTETITITVK